MDEKVSEHNQNSFVSKRLSIPGQYYQDFRNEDISPSLFPSSVLKQTKITSPSLQAMNIKNPLTAFNYMSLFRPTPLDTAQSSMNNHHFDPMNTTQSNQQIESNSTAYSTAQSANFLEEPTVLKLNIPIEMIVRTIPQQSPSSSGEQCNHRCTHPTHAWPTTQTPCQISSNYTSKPATSHTKSTRSFFW